MRDEHGSLETHQTSGPDMSEKVKFLLTFRARLMLLLTSFLLLTIVLVLVLDHWARIRAEEEVLRQTEEIEAAVSGGFGDLAIANSLAMRSLSSNEFLYEQVSAEELPKTVEFIIVTDKEGQVKDSTFPNLINGFIQVPQDEVGQQWPVDPVMEEGEDHEHQPVSYYHPVETTKGLHWIVIVTTQHTIINRIEQASNTLASRNRDLSNYRVVATTGLLTLALAIVVFIGWRFTRPIKELAAAARKVAGGDLGFRVRVRRADEVGQLGATFNEMISELKSKQELEEKLNQAERAAVIGRLTQSVAHEIRNPLNVINLSIDHVSNKFAPEDPAKRSEFTRVLSSIKDEVVRLKHMVNDLLNYGRPAQLSVRRVDIRDLVKETITLIKPQADEQDVEITVEGEGPAEVQADPERLKSCLSNIAINALQAMPAGGKLIANVRRRDSVVEVSITDTGVGIGEDALTRVFEPYFSTKESGFGLGLAVTKKIVEDHRGSIQVSSEIKRGTTFTVRLPIADDKMEVPSVRERETVRLADRPTGRVGEI